MNKKQLVDALAERSDLPKTKVYELLGHMDDLLVEAIGSEERVRFLSLGSFESRELAPRTFRDPNTSQKRLLGTRRSVRFRPSQTLRNRVNQGVEAHWRDPRHQHAWRTASTLVADVSLYNPEHTPTFPSDADDRSVHKACSVAFGDDWSRAEDTYVEKVDDDVREAFDYLAYCARSTWG